MDHSNPMGNFDHISTHVIESYYGDGYYTERRFKRHGVVWASRDWYVSFDDVVWCREEHMMRVNGQVHTASYITGIDASGYVVTRRTWVIGALSLNHNLFEKKWVPWSAVVWC